MANLAKVLKEEIARLAKKSNKSDFKSLKADVVRLKREVSQAKKALATLSRQLRSVAKAVPAREEKAESQELSRIRPSGKTVRNLRAKFGLSQADFGKLAGVSLQSVANWEAHEGRIKMRGKTLATLASILKIGAREAKQRLAGLKGGAKETDSDSKASQPQPKAKRGRKPGRKPGKKADDKTVKTPGKKRGRKPGKVAGKKPGRKPGRKPGAKAEAAAKANAQSK